MFEYDSGLYLDRKKNELRALRIQQETYSMLFANGISEPAKHYLNTTRTAYNFNKAIRAYSSKKK